MVIPTVTPRLRWRWSGEIFLAAALPALLFAGMCAATGQMETAWRRYILQNLVYVIASPAATVGEGMRDMWRVSVAEGHFPLLFCTTLAGLLAATVYFLWRRVRPSALWVAGAAVTLAALTAVIAPRRDYLHYILLLPVPLTLWFVETRRDYEAALPKMRLRAEDGGIWVIWPKTTKSAKPDINGNIVREAALSVGLVDFKICAVDQVWSGMRFAVKRP